MDYIRCIILFISNILIYYVQYAIFQRIFLEYMVDDKNVTINDYVIVADVIIYMYNFTVV